MNDKDFPTDIFEISIWLDSYDDIFSDFDSRPVSERTVSDDFLTEVRKVCDEKSRQKIHLKLSLPAARRNPETEKIIIKRLHLHFRNNYALAAKDARQKNIKGVYFIIAGIILMLCASYISYLKVEKFFSHLLLILFEPAGWFFLWSGLDHIVYFSQSKKEDIGYYQKMAEGSIRFVDLHD